MIIVHLSDSHICLPEPAGSHRLSDLAQVVEKIQAMTPAPDIIVHSGDIVHTGNQEEYRAAKEILSELPAPLLVIPGNKDERVTMGQIFADNLGGSAQNEFFQYCVETPHIRFIMLDTLDPGHRLGKLCDARLEEIRTLLHQDRNKQTVVFMHHPTFDVVEAPQPFQFDKRETVEKFDAIILNNPQVSHIYCGHSHRYGNNRIGDTLVSAIPSLAIDLRWGEYDKTMENTAIFEVYHL